MIKVFSPIIQNFLASSSCAGLLKGETSRGIINKAIKYPQARNSDLFLGSLDMKFFELVISKKKPVQQALEQNAFPKKKGRNTRAINIWISVPDIIPAEASKKI